jgi:hypothetical protein
LHRLGIALHEAGIEERHHWNIEPVQPHDRIGSRIAVVVPGPRGRDDEIARVHRHALAIHRGVRARAFDDEAQRGLRMPVARRDLAGQDQLQPGVQRVRDGRGTAQRRVLEDEDAPLRFRRRDQLARFHDVGADVAVFPQRGNAGRGGSRRDQRAEHFPQRREIVARDAIVELSALGIALECPHHVNILY